MENNLVLVLRNELEQHVDEATKDSAHRFFKEEVTFHGVKTSIVRNIAKKYFARIKDMNKAEVFSLCEELLRSDYSEEAFIPPDLNPG